MKLKVLCFTVLTAALLVGGWSRAYADFKTYAATECERWDENVDPATFLNGGRRFNPSSTTRLRLDCPAVKDRSTDIRSSWIRVIDRHPQDQVCARLIAYRQLGAAVVIRTGNARCSGIELNSPDAVQLNTGGLGAIPSDAHYYLSVYRIPATFERNPSGVVTYFIEEFD